MENVFEKALRLPMTRRSLIKVVAAAGAATWAGGLAGSARGAGGDFTDFMAIAPSAADQLQVPDGYAADLVIKWGDEFAEGMRFGYNCDYSAFFPLPGVGQDEGLLWVNHEYVIPLFTSDWRASQDPTWDPRVEPYRSIMAQEKKEVGGSILHVRRAGIGGPWQIVYGSPYSRRFTATGPVVPYDGPVAGSGLVPDEGVLGTLANCSGASTPWGTVLSCEENYQSFGLKRLMPFNNGWDNDGDPNYYVGEPGVNAYGEPAVEKPNYGYVAEIDPYTGAAVKHTSLGRIHHENVAMRIAADGRVVCYTGDDAPAADGMFFKFVSAHPYTPGMSRAEAMGLLSEGQLYVAQWLPTANDPAVDAGTGFWRALDMSDPEACAFTTRWVVDNIIPAVGGTLSQFRVPRAEDCEIYPGDPRQVIISLTSARGRPADAFTYGVVRLLTEDSEAADSPAFTWHELLEGGPHTGFASPDNLGFTSPQDLWVVTDISASSLNRPGRGFEWHANNALFYVPLRGTNANTAYRFANAPVGAELTGPTFHRPQKTLFLNVQHPGENTSTNANPANPAEFTSWWPDGNRTTATGTPGKPKPSLVAIRKL
jgi:hypothetical protein